MWTEYARYELSRYQEPANRPDQQVFLPFLEVHVTKKDSEQESASQRDYRARIELAQQLGALSLVLQPSAENIRKLAAFRPACPLEFLGGQRLASPEKCPKSAGNWPRKSDPIH